MQRIRMAGFDVYGTTLIRDKQGVLGGLVVGHGGDQMDGNVPRGDLRGQCVHLCCLGQSRLLCTSNAMPNQQQQGQNEGLQTISQVCRMERAES